MGACSSAWCNGTRSECFDFQIMKTGVMALRAEVRIYKTALIVPKVRNPIWKTKFPETI